MSRLRVLDAMEIAEARVRDAGHDDPRTDGWHNYIKPPVVIPPGSGIRRRFAVRCPEPGCPAAFGDSVDYGWHYQWTHGSGRVCWSADLERARTQVHLALEVYGGGLDRYEVRVLPYEHHGDLSRIQWRPRTPPA